MNSKKMNEAKKNINLNNKTEKGRKTINNDSKNKVINIERGSLPTSGKNTKKLKRTATENINSKKSKKKNFPKKGNTVKNDDFFLNKEKESKSSIYKSSFVSSSSSNEGGSKFIETIKLINEIQKNFEESIKSNNHTSEEVKQIIKPNVRIDDYIPLTEEEKTNLEKDIIKSSDLRIQNYKTAFSYIDTALNKIRNALDTMDLLDITEESSNIGERKLKNSYNNSFTQKHNNKVGELTSSGRYADYINSDNLEFESENYNSQKMKIDEKHMKKIYLTKNMGKKAASIENLENRKINSGKNNYRIYTNQSKNISFKSTDNNFQAKTSSNLMAISLKTTGNTSKSKIKGESISAFKKRISYSPPPVISKKKRKKVS